MPPLHTNYILRPDLAAMPVNPAYGYIADEVFPTLPQTLKANNLAYMPIQTDQALVSRTPGTDPGRVLGSNAVIAYQTAERFVRAGVDYADFGQIGSMEAVDMIGTIRVKRAVMADRETRARNALFANNNTTAGQGLNASGQLDISTSADPVAAIINNGLNCIKRGQGKGRYLVAGKDTLYDILRSVSVEDAIYKRVTEGIPLGDRLKAPLLASLLGIDGVVEGDSTIWDAAGYRGYAALMWLPKADPMALLTECQFGRNVTYYPEDLPPSDTNGDYSQAMQIGWYDNAAVFCWDYTGVAWDVVKILNANACLVIKGITPATTTTSTTTSSTPTTTP